MLQEYCSSLSVKLTPSLGLCGKALPLEAAHMSVSTTNFSLVYFVLLLTTPLYAVIPYFPQEGTSSSPHYASVSIVPIP